VADRVTGTALGPGGEFDRIRAIAAVLGESAAALGDDTAEVPHGVGRLVASTDTSTEGVHFRRSWLADEEIGWRAAAAALSDLAAAGARPAGLLAALTLPAGAPRQLAPDLMAGVAAAARHVGARVLGGDLSTGPGLALTVTVLGHAAHPVARRGARPGDGIWVTGELGGARAALVAWSAGRKPAAGARGAFAHPTPRVAAGQWLAAHGATAMLDLSDGLAGDATHLAAASGVGISIDLSALPIHSSVHAEAESMGEAACRFAAVGGEDYELLVALPAGFDGAADLEAATGTSLRAVGVVVEGAGARFLHDGVAVALDGFRHAV
jgi:thiamine-monophosphate kinase